MYRPNKLVRNLLYPFAYAYGGIISFRNYLFDTQKMKSVKFDFPIISIGNLSTGGTGKTPHTEYLINLLKDQYQTAVLSRGYGRNTKGYLLAQGNVNAQEIGDEPMQYFFKNADIKVAVSEQRLIGIPALLNDAPDTEIILLDDAMQHRRVQPGLNIMLTDYSLPFYKDAMLPSGNLREPRSGYKRADIIIVTKCPQHLSANEKLDITKQIQPNTNQKIYFSTLSYQEPYPFLGDGNYYFSLKNAHILLIAGIANEKPLVDYLEKNGASVTLLNFGDHHFFTLSDLEFIKESYDIARKENPETILLTTEKDIVRLALHIKQLQEWKMSIWVLPITVTFLEKEKEFNNDILLYTKNTKEKYSIH